MRYLPCYLLLGFLISCSITSSNEIDNENMVNRAFSLIPIPKKIKKTNDFFVIDNKTLIRTSIEFKKEAEYLKNLIEGSSFFKPKIIYDTQSELANVISLEKTTDVNNQIKEYYYLSTGNNSITIKASHPEGVFRGIQTLRQIMPVKFHKKSKKNSWAISGVTIEDYPVFKWRGLLLDCCRHFFDKKIVMKYIDLLAYYKMNTLHWHLTEDQGWRIAIDQYPKLTKKGAWRTEKDGTKYGGFYSKEDIKEIIAYAEERHINIVPEIEMPGHSQAAIASYPYLSCTGEQLEVGNKWGVFKDVYCAGNDSTFKFLENVLSEVIELFPGEYIHIGGDECPKYRWENCNKCQKIIKSHNLENEHQLQSYFIKRIADFLQRKKRKLIGWDEILEGGLPKNAIVQSWRGMNGAMESANNNQFAISSPTSHSYFDYDLQAIDLEKVYSFNPIPKDLNSEKHSFILGGECNMWTEHVPSEKNLDSKVFPRILAMSEVLWSAPKNRNYKDFYERVQYQYKYLEAFGVNYGAETIPVRLDAYTSPEKINITLTKGAKDLDLYYTTNGIIPSKNSTLYKTNIDLKKSSNLLIQAYKNNKPYGECSKHKFTKHLGNGIEPNLDYKYSKFYTGGGKNALTNGVRGSNNFRDGNWQGVQKSNMGIIINLGKEQKINTLSAAFFQKQDSWIFLPRKIEFFSSNDGKTFSLIKTLTNTISPKKDGEFIKEFTIELQNTTSKYVKIVAHNISFCPKWHPAAGSEAWLFIDEFVVQ